MDRQETLEDRFWSKVNVKGPDECWGWTGAKSHKGYGAIGEGGKRGKTLRAHRVSWEFTYGAIPEGMQILHHCDNPGCMNPRHLFLGTNADNRADMIKKGRGRYVRGEQHPRSKLTEQDIRNIHKSALNHCALGRLYSVHYSTIWQIKHGKIWRWVA